MTIHKFKFPVLHTVIYALAFLMMNTIVVAMLLSLINEGGFLNVAENPVNIVFNIIIYILLPSFLMTLGIIGMRRLRFAFTKISIDMDNKKLISWRGNRYKELSFDSINGSKDIPNKGVLILESEREAVVIPKEIENYSLLYGILKHNNLINEMIAFDGLKTTLTMLYWVIGSGFLILGLFPVFMLTDLIINYEDSKNSTTALVILPSLVVGVLTILILFANRYEFTYDSIVKINPLFKKRIKYSNIKTIAFNQLQRTITIELIEDKQRWLRKLNGQKGIVIMEPGNLSIETMYFELEQRMTTCNNV